MNYGELKTAIQQYVENYETPFVSNLGTFVRNAEQRILNSVNLPATRVTASATLTTGVATITLPANFLAPISLYITVGGLPVFLLNKELDYLSELYPATTQAQPTLYAQVDDATLVVRPVPDAGYAYTLQYYGNVDSIVGADGQTSWLGDNFDSVLMFGALVEGAVFNKQDPTIYETAYQEKLSLLITLINGKNQQDQYRAGAPRATVV